MPTPDRLELRHDGGHRAFAQRGVREVDERRHAFGFDEVRRGIHGDDRVEVAQVDARPARAAVAKEVRGRLGEADAVAAGRRREPLAQPGDLVRVRGHRDARGAIAGRKVRRTAADRGTRGSSGSS
jgi:hypothetical protein